MNKKTSDSESTAKKEQYLLKSVFIRRKLRIERYYEIIKEMDRIVEEQGETIEWKERSSWGITQEAWEIVSNSNINPILVFCHPEIINLQPTTVLYYRSLALIPQKGFQTIIGRSPLPYESGKKKPNTLKNEECLKIAFGINEVLSNTLRLSNTIEQCEIIGMLFAQAGMTTDGSWRNQIGTEGQLMIWLIIIRGLLESGEISSVSSGHNRDSILLTELSNESLLENPQEYKSLNLSNGAYILYASEPDITIWSAGNDMLAAIEVKAGLDPAAALERTGAVLKTFESVLAEYPPSTTILITSCETEESNLRVNESKSVHYKYLTATLATNETQKRKFITLIRKCAGLIK